MTAVRIRAFILHPATGKLDEIPIELAKRLSTAPRKHGWRPNPIVTNTTGLETAVMVVDAGGVMRTVTAKTQQARKCAEGAMWLNAFAALAYFGSTTFQRRIQVSLAAPSPLRNRLSLVRAALGILATGPASTPAIAEFLEGKESERAERLAIGRTVLPVADDGEP